jgi:P-type Ca2+ transporter type 2B
LFLEKYTHSFFFRRKVSEKREISGMITTNSSSTDLRITLEEIRDLMEHRGLEGVRKVQDLGGVEGIIEKLRSSADKGLSSEDLDYRRNVFGANMLPSKPSKSLIRLVYDAIQDVTLIVLLVAAVLSLVLSLYPEKDDELQRDHFEWIEGLAILVSVIVVVVVTALNDYSKERQFRQLQSRIEGDHKFSVLRDGCLKELLVNELVVGDICLVKLGDLIPADGILIQVS